MKSPTQSYISLPCQPPPVASQFPVCYIWDMNENTAYEQKDMNMVVSKPVRNPWIESSLNAKAYFEAFRGQCRLRIDYAGLQEEKAWRPVDWKPHAWCKKKAEFWARSGEYWKRKLEESFQREKDYLGDK